MARTATHKADYGDDGARGELRACGGQLGRVGEPLTRVGEVGAFGGELRAYDGELRNALVSSGAAAAGST